MSNPTWLNRVEIELLRRKLPRQEVSRLLAELADHLSDLADSEAEVTPRQMAGSSAPGPLSPLQKVPMSMEANAVECLGSPSEIADSAAREFHRRNLLSRSRLAALGTFVLLPLPLLVAAWLALITIVGYSLDLLAGAAAVDDLGERMRDAAQMEIVGVHVLLIASLVIPAAGVAAFLGWLARRTSRRWLWGLTACTLVGLGFGAARYDLNISDQSGQSQL